MHSRIQNCHILLSVTKNACLQFIISNLKKARSHTRSSTHRCVCRPILQREQSHGSVCLANSALRFVLHELFNLHAYDQPAEPRFPNNILRHRGYPSLLLTIMSFQFSDEDSLTKRQRQQVFAHTLDEQRRVNQELRQQQQQKHDRGWSHNANAVKPLHSTVPGSADIDNGSNRVIPGLEIGSSTKEAVDTYSSGGSSAKLPYMSALSEMNGRPLHVRQKQFEKESQYRNMLRDQIEENKRRKVCYTSIYYSCDIPSVLTVCWVLLGPVCWVLCSDDRGDVLQDVELFAADCSFPMHGSLRAPTTVPYTTSAKYSL